MELNMKQCNLSNCDAEHEGICTHDLENCTAKSDDDLITEDEYDSMNQVQCKKGEINES